MDNSGTTILKTREKKDWQKVEKLLKLLIDNHVFKEKEKGVLELCKAAEKNIASRKDEIERTCN